MFRRSYFPEPVSERIIRSSIVADNGQLSPWGSFHLAENGSSHEYWIQDLVERSQAGFRVKLAAADGNGKDGKGLWLVNQAGQEQVFVPRESIFWLRNGTRDYQVVVGGYLLWLENSPETIKRYTEVLEQVLRGERPSLLENSPFIQVAKEWQGQQLKVLGLNPEEDCYQVYTVAGQRVIHQMSYPLALERWVR